MKFTPHVICLLAVASLGAGSVPPPTYRGFSPGMSYRTFADRARTLAALDTLRCNTSASTAQLMECGVKIRDPKAGRS